MSNKNINSPNYIITWKFFLSGNYLRAQKIYMDASNFCQVKVNHLVIVLAQNLPETDPTELVG